MNSTDVLNQVKQLAANIKLSAHEVLLRLESGKDILATAHELVRDSSTFVFTLGEMYALKQAGTTTRTAHKTTGTPVASRNYHNMRDSRGRFTRKV